MDLQFASTLAAANALFQRYRRGAAFRLYIKRHGLGVLAGALVLLALALACTAATIVFVGGKSPWRVFLALLATPAVLAGNLGLLLYIFFAWLETRAIPAPLPRLPWPPLALFVGLPFLMLAWLSWPAALALALAAGALPFVYARLDQQAAAKV